MSQVIKLKRGGIEGINLTTPSSVQGELILGTGSFSNGLTGSLFIAETDNKLRLPYTRIDSINDGAALATNIGNNAAFDGLLIHSASNNKLYRYNGTAFAELEIAAGSFTGTLGVGSGGTGQNTLTDGAVLMGAGTDGIESVTMTNGQFLIGNTSNNPSAVNASTIAGGGLTATTGAGTATLNVDSGSIAINDLDTSTALSVANGGTNATSFADKAVIISQDSGTDTLSALALTTNGALVAGGSSAGPSVVAPAALGGSGITATGGDGTLVLSVDNLNNTINVAAGGISVNTGSISSGGTNLVNAGVINTLSASIATDINANTGNVEGVAGQVAYFDDTNSVSGSGGFTFASDVLTVGTSTFGTNVTVAGDLTVSGTTTTVDSTNVNIGDNIIVLNTAEASQDGGIQVIDTSALNTTGSLLWDRGTDYWAAGVKGSEKRIAVQAALGDLTENKLVNVNNAGELEASTKFEDDGSNGIITNPKLVTFNGGNANGVGVLFENSGVVGAVTTEGSDELAHIFGTKTDGTLVFSNVIDGGTF